MTLADKPWYVRALAALLSPFLILVILSIGTLVAAVFSPIICIVWPDKIDLGTFERIINR